MAGANPGKKYDGGKAPVFQGFRQYFPRAIAYVAMISKYGAEKYNLDYSDVNWSRVEGGFERYSDGLERHQNGEFIDGPTDPESGKLHAGHIAWNAMARLEILLRKLEEEQKSKGNG